MVTNEVPSAPIAGVAGVTPGSLLQVPAAPLDVGTAVVSVVGAALFAVLGLRLTYLAVRTRTNVTAAQEAIWEYFGYAGAVALVYGALALVELYAELTLPFLRGVLLAFALLFALVMREAYYNATLSNAEVDRFGQYQVRRGVEFGFVGIVLLAAVGPMVRPDPTFTILAGLAAVGVVAYGAYFQYRRTRDVPTRGTLVDGLMRQSLPVLVFTGAALVAPSLAFGAVEPAVARAIAGVFVVVTAASLLTVTIKLGQHLATHR